MNKNHCITGLALPHRVASLAGQYGRVFRQREYSIRLINESVLFKTGLSASTLPHMNHDVAVTPGQRKVWHEKMREREADLKARGILS